MEALPTLARARAAGLEVAVRVPVYDQPTWRGYRPGKPQIYPGWVTPREHPAMDAVAYPRVASPLVAQDGPGGGLRAKPRVSRWVFSTDGLGSPWPLTPSPCRPSRAG